MILFSVAVLLGIAITFRDIFNVVRRLIKGSKKTLSTVATLAVDAATIDEDGNLIEAGKNGCHVIEYIPYYQLEKIIGVQNLKNIISVKNTVTITGELDTKEVEEVSVNEDGTESVVKKTVDVVDPSTISEYARFFDDGCTGWTKDPEYNLMFLRDQQRYANDLLQSKGHLFLNEVYDMLGIPRTKAGQVVGWFYDEKHPVGDNFVDFGIYDTNRGTANRDFVNGYERTILLDFNVDGPILEYI